MKSIREKWILIRVMMLLNASTCPSSRTNISTQTRPSSPSNPLTLLNPLLKQPAIPLSHLPLNQHSEPAVAIDCVWLMGIWGLEWKVGVYMYTLFVGGGLPFFVVVAEGLGPGMLTL